MEGDRECIIASQSRAVSHRYGSGNQRRSVRCISCSNGFNAIDLFLHDRLRIFSSSSREAMNEQLAQENQGLVSTSVTATHFLHERRLRSQKVSGGTANLAAQGQKQTASIVVSTGTRSNESSRATPALDERSWSSLERRRLELEIGTGADHDVPYSFALPASMPQTLAWIRLLVRVQRGEVQP